MVGRPGALPVEGVRRVGSSVSAPLAARESSTLAPEVNPSVHIPDLQFGAQPLAGAPQADLHRSKPLVLTKLQLANVVGDLLMNPSYKASCSLCALVPFLWSGT